MEFNPEVGPVGEMLVWSLVWRYMLEDGISFIESLLRYWDHLMYLAGHHPEEFRRLAFDTY